MSQAGSYNGGGTPAGDVETLTGNIGGPVGPDGAFNINIIGADGLTVTGTPLNNTLTIRPNAGAFVLTLSDDTNIKVAPDATGNIQIEGINGITVTGDMMNNKLTISGAGAGGNEIKITKFTADGVFTKDPRSLYITAYIWNGGSGGGSGAQGVSGSARGGSGGAGGSFLCLQFPSIQFTNAVPVVIGQGGVGGASQLGASTNGNPGTVGGVSSLGDIAPSTLNNPAGGGGGDLSSGAGSPQQLVGPISEVCARISNGGGLGFAINGTDATNIGLSVTSSGWSNYFQYPASGGGGGSGANNSIIYSGGNGGNIGLFGEQLTSVPIILQAGGMGGSETTTIDGGHGLDAISTTGGRYIGATGGGGGGGQSTGLVAGNGGNGGIPGGGGGGGGGSLNGTPSGAGGNGGRGEIWVIETLGTLTV